MLTLFWKVSHFSPLCLSSPNYSWACFPIKVINSRALIWLDLCQAWHEIGWQTLGSRSLPPPSGCGGKLCGAAVSAAVVDNWFLPCLDELLFACIVKYSAVPWGLSINIVISFFWLFKPFHSQLTTFLVLHTYLLCYIRRWPKNWKNQMRIEQFDCLLFLWVAIWKGKCPGCLFS